MVTMVTMVSIIHTVQAPAIKSSLLGQMPMPMPMPR